MKTLIIIAIVLMLIWSMGFISSQARQLNRFEEHNLHPERNKNVTRGKDGRFKSLK